MTAAAQHPMSAAIETLLAAAAEAPMLEHRITEVAAYAAALVTENVDLRASCTALARRNVSLEADTLAMEQLDTQRVAVITELKNRMAKVSADVEQLLQTASIRLAGETADFNRIRAIRDTLDPTVTAFPDGARAQRVPTNPNRQLA